MRRRIFALALATAIAPLVSSFAVGRDDNGVAFFTKLRMDYAKRPDFDPRWEDHEERKKITDLWSAGKIDEGMGLAEQWLIKHPVDAKMQLWYAFFLRKKGDFQGYFRHRHLYQGLLASISSSGTGLSPDSPMKVISVSEEYTVLRDLGAKLKQQALLTNEAGTPCDRMECELEGKSITLYFDVTISMEHTRRSLLNPKTEDRPPSDKPKEGEGK